jgi:hypothetical protein
VSYCDGDDPSDPGGGARWLSVAAAAAIIGGALWVLQRLLG